MSTVTITVRRGSIVSSAFIRSWYWLRSWNSTGGFISRDLLGGVGRRIVAVLESRRQMGDPTGRLTSRRGNAHEVTAVATVHGLASHVAGRLRNRDGSRADEPTEGQQ